MPPNNPLGPRPGGNASKLNISATTVLKASPGTVYQINVVTAGSAAGSINDVATTGGVAASNEIASIPNTVGPVEIGPFPCFTGITVAPGTGQVVSVSFS